MQKCSPGAGPGHSHIALTGLSGLEPSQRHPATPSGSGPAPLLLNQKELLPGRKPLSPPLETR